MYFIQVGKIKMNQGFGIDICYCLCCKASFRNTIGVLSSDKLYLQKSLGLSF